MNELAPSAPIQQDCPKKALGSLGFFRTIFRHLLSWAAEYSALILTMVSVFVTAQLYYILTGRRPEENLMWLVNFSERSIAIALAITFTSMAREAFGTWYTKDELLSMRPAVAIAHGVRSLVIFVILLYALTH